MIATIRLVSSAPFISGMSRSVMTRRGFFLPMNSIASRPLEASPMVQGLLLVIACTSGPIVVSSSTSRMDVSQQGSQWKSGPFKS